MYKFDFILSAFLYKSNAMYNNFRSRRMWAERQRQPIFQASAF